MNDIVPSGYAEFLEELKNRVRERQTRAILAVNAELIALYWDIGERIVEKQEQAHWGDAIVERLIKDLQAHTPGVNGFSKTNVFFMRRLYLTYRHESELVQQAVKQIPWGHHTVLMVKVKDPAERVWYLQKTLEHGWSRNVLLHHIETQLHTRQITTPKSDNFSLALPDHESDLVRQALKDEYIFDFLTLRDDAKERELEDALVAKLRDFMLELGHGFAFMGRQYRLTVNDEDYFVDLLFYHHRLRCLVAIELKAGKFQPAYVGQLNFYLSALDDLVRHPEDRPSVGILLCKQKDRVTAEYALRGTTQPMSVSTYRTEILAQLPTVEQLQAVLNDALELEAMK
jgi:predicted nuclease of restriction endonuclease-like (RecB) superfamily